MPNGKKKQQQQQKNSAKQQGENKTGKGIESLISMRPSRTLEPETSIKLVEVSRQRGSLLTQL